MKLIIGTLSYVAAGSLLIAAFVFLGMQFAETGPRHSMVPASVQRPVLSAGAAAVEPADPNRKPIWIVPTTKYDYTPPVRPTRQTATAPRPEIRQDVSASRRPSMIGRDARRAMASATREAAAEERPASPATAYIRRDNSPFYRD